MQLRNFIAVFFILTGFFSRAETPAFSHFCSKPDTSYCLEIEGKVHNADQNGGSCLVELLLNDRVVDSAILRGNRKKFKFRFKKNEHYSIRITKEGFQGKSVCVHTDIDGFNLDNYQFYFETTLLIAKPDSQPQAPVATIYFNAKKQCFYYVRSNMNSSPGEVCQKAPLTM